ncbi:hypothetical protein HZH66_002387 [Vespula vulgaris]|uniref:Uncharacterized protein n=1 Tax=Vespula vulgaris TaxID=7454 RepID=A0A834NF66_VESVU|nr:hypothetical protein HZH66_002387 [Vespula vulgaris]
MKIYHENISCRDRYVDLERSSDDDDDDDDHHPSLRRSCKASTKMESKEYCGVAVSWLALLLPILSWLDWYAGRLLSIAETKRCPTYKPPFPLPREPIIVIPRCPILQDICGNEFNTEVL